MYKRIIIVVVSFEPHSGRCQSCGVKHTVVVERNGWGKSDVGVCSGDTKGHQPHHQVTRKRIFQKSLWGVLTNAPVRPTGNHEPTTLQRHGAESKSRGPINEMAQRRTHTLREPNLLRGEA